jgi:hypothetical protein
MGIIIVSALLTLLAAVGAALCFRIGFRQWHGEGKPLSTWMTGTVFMDFEALAGLDRAIFVFGSMWAFAAFFCAGFIVLAAQGGQGIAGLTLDGVGVAGFILSGVVYFGIVNFNRPRFLVPPHLRSQPGAIAGRRQRRRKNRRPL